MALTFIAGTSSPSYYTIAYLRRRASSSIVADRAYSYNCIIYIYIYVTSVRNFKFSVLVGSAIKSTETSS